VTDDGARGATDVLWCGGAGSARGGGGDSALGDSVLSTDELPLSADDDLSDPTSRHRAAYSADDDDDDDDVTPHVTCGEFQDADVTRYFHSLQTRYRRQSGKRDAVFTSYLLFTLLCFPIISHFLMFIKMVLALESRIYTETSARGVPKGIFKGFIPPKSPKLDLTTDAEYVAFSKCQYVVVNVQQCSLLHGYAIPA